MDFNYDYLGAIVVLLVAILGVEVIRLCLSLKSKFKKEIEKK